MSQASLAAKGFFSCPFSFSTSACHHAVILHNLYFCAANIWCLLSCFFLFFFSNFNLFGMLCHTMSWNKSGLNGKLITRHFSPKDAADLCYAQIPSVFFRYPESSRLAWSREQLSPAEREAKFFWQVTTKGFLSCAEALQCALDPWGFTRNWWDRGADWLVMPASSLECKCVCTAWAGGLITHYGVSQAQLHA